MSSSCDSADRLFSTLRDENPFDLFPAARTNYFYFAGRPIAQWTKIPGQDLEIQFIVTDHLGSPVGLLDSSGNVIWRGFLDPFGSDYRNGPSSSGLHLRLPGQLDDPRWQRLSENENGHAADLYYNVHRWYESGTGRYVSADPLGTFGGEANLFLYAGSRPTSKVDPLGLVSWNCSSLGFQVALGPGVSQQWGTCSSECSGGTRWLINYDWRQLGFGASTKFSLPIAGSGFKFDDGWPTASPDNFRYSPQLCSTGWSISIGAGFGGSSTGTEPSFSGETAGPVGSVGGGVFTGCGSFKVNRPRRVCCDDFPMTIGPANPDDGLRPNPTIGAVP